jgi:hypothetical protein
LKHRRTFKTQTQNGIGDQEDFERPGKNGLGRKIWKYLERTALNRRTWKDVIVDL